MKKLYLGLSIWSQSLGGLSDALGALADEFAEMDLDAQSGEGVDVPTLIWLEHHGSGSDELGEEEDKLWSVSGSVREEEYDDEPLGLGLDSEETQELDAVALPL